MDYLFHGLELAALGWLIWKAQTPPAPPTVIDVVRQALDASSADGTLRSGRNRLRAHLAAKQSPRDV